MRTCQDCGAVWESYVRFCEVCGSPLTNEAAGLAYDRMKKRTVTTWILRRRTRTEEPPYPGYNQQKLWQPRSRKEYPYGRRGLLSGVLAVGLGIVIPVLGLVLGFIAVYFGLKAVLHDPTRGLLAIILGSTGFLLTVYWLHIILTI
ncbi:MAG: hypothetical protein V3V98_06385 [Thermoplasmata archaeon]